MPEFKEKNIIKKKQTTYLEAGSLTTTRIVFDHLVIFCHYAVVFYPYYKNKQSMQVSIDLDSQDR